MKFSTIILTSILIKNTFTTASDIEQISTTTAIPSKLSNAYEECHNNQRLCFGINSDVPNCMDSSDCVVLFSSVANSKGDVQMELYWDRGFTSSNNYAAVGLSNDGTMGEVSVTECMLNAEGNVILQDGWNPSGHTPTEIVHDNINTLLETSFTNGVVYCKWLRNAFSSIRGHEFDIKNNSYYLLLAYGPTGIPFSSVYNFIFVRLNYKI